VENYTPAASTPQPRPKTARRLRAGPAVAKGRASKPAKSLIIAHPLPALLAPEAPPALPLAPWSEMTSFVAAVEHWLEHDAFNEGQINHLLDERAVPVVRAKLAMLWAFCDESQRFRCDLEPARDAVARHLCEKLQQRRADFERRGELLRKIVARGRT
jgi:hypothetical protein